MSRKSEKEKKEAWCRWWEHNPGSRKSQCRAPEAGADSVSAGAAGERGRRVRKMEPKAHVRCGGVGCDQEFGLFLIAVGSWWRVLSLRMPRSDLRFNRLDEEWAGDKRGGRETN